METKICNKCGIEKNINEFRRIGKYYRAECKKCACLYAKEYRKKHTEQVKEYNLKYRKENKDVIKEQMKKYHSKYYQKNKDKIKEKSNKYYYENIELVKKCQKKYKNNNKEKLKKHYKEYYELNRDKINEYQKQYVYNKRINNKEFKFKCQIRHMLDMSFTRKQKRKSRKLESIVGCNIKELINYLIKTYENNYNEKWNWKYSDNVHIDHIKPLSLAQTEEDIIKLNHYTNLQLLKAEDNLKKGNKLDWRLNNDK